MSTARDRGVQTDASPQSPISTLPAEILAEIFLFAHAFSLSLVYVPSTATLSMNCIPWTLAHVSSFWRAVATSIPYLWTTLAMVQKTSRSKTGARGLAQLLDHVLAYSTTKPIDVSVTFGATDSISPEIIWRKLLTHDRRWKTAAFRFLPGSYWPKVPVFGVFDHLEAVQLVAATSGADPDGKMLDDDFWLSPAPRLTSLRLQNFPYVTKGTIPWSQLTSLEIRDTNDQNRYENILPLLKNLQRLHCLMPAPRGARVHTLAHLTSCEWDVLTGHSPYRYLHLPSLLHWCVFPRNLELGRWSPLVVSLLARSRCTPKSLQFAGRFWGKTYHDVVYSFQLVPSIQELNLYGSEWDVWLDCHGPYSEVDRVWYSLLVHQGCTDPLLPSLTKLTVPVLCDSFEVDDFAELVESRWWVSRHNRTCQLEVVRLADPHMLLSPPSRERLEQRLMVLVGEGLDFEIHHD